jgi:hypothetical protein
MPCCFFIIAKTQRGRVPFYGAFQLSGNVAKAAQSIGTATTSILGRAQLVPISN